MFRNYLVIALRNIARQKLYSFAQYCRPGAGDWPAQSSSSCSCATSCPMINGLLAAENLYRLEETIQVPGRRPLPLAVTPYPMAAAMRDRKSLAWSA